MSRLAANVNRSLRLRPGQALPWHTESMTGFVPPDVVHELDDKAARLRVQLGDLTAPVEDGSTIGFGKRIGDGTTQAIQQSADASSARDLWALLAQVLRAKAKVDEGTWGMCDVCGEAIDAGRLEFRPWSVTCVEHADPGRR